ncbi:hypothetical protein GCM10010232_05780 [Streptomyces amakusaensis]
MEASGPGGGSEASEKSANSAYSPAAAEEPGEEPGEEPLSVAVRATTTPMTRVRHKVNKSGGVCISAAP